MTTPALYELGPDMAQECLETSNPSLYEAAQARLSVVSHHNLFISDFRTASYIPVPFEDYSPENHIEFERAAEVSDSAMHLLSDAYAEFSNGAHEEEDVTLEDLSEIAQVIALDEAISAKMAGDTEKSIKFMESAMTLFCAIPSEIRDWRTDEKFIHGVIVNGLGLELVTAAHNVRGITCPITKSDGVISSLEDFITLPLASPSLLKIASDMDFSSDFKTIKPLDDKNKPELYNELMLRDYVALSLDARYHKDDAGQADNYLEAAVDKLLIDDFEVGFEDVTNLVSRIKHETNLNVSEQLEKLRQARQAGFEDRENLSLCAILDRAIVSLVAEGKEDLARLLISSAKNDPEQLDPAIKELGYEPGVEQIIKDTLKTLVETKRQKLSEALTLSGLSPDIQREITDSATDPDAAAGIDNSFWNLYSELPVEAKKVFLASSSMNRATSVIMVLAEKDMLTYAKQLITNACKLSDPEALSTYVLSYKKLVSYFDEQPASFMATTNVLPIDFLCFSDPFKAYQANRVIAGSGDEEMSLSILKDFYQPEEGNFIVEPLGQPAIEALAALKNAIVTNSLPENHSTVFMTLIRANENPVELINDLVPTLNLLDGVDSNENALLWAIGRAPCQDTLRHALTIVKQKFHGINKEYMGQLMQEVALRAGRDGALDSYAFSLYQTDNLLQMQGLDLETIGFSEFIHIHERFQYDNKFDTPDGKATFERYCDVLRADAQVRRDNIDSHAEMEDFPEIVDLFQRLQLSPKLSQEIFGSWSSFNAFKRRLHADNRLRSGIVDEQYAEQAAEEQYLKLRTDYRALNRYTEIFGADEVRQIIGLFGIHHFARYYSYDLHSQLIAWKKGKVPTRNLVISAHDDWNNALQSEGRESKQILGGKGLFCFEVGNPSEIAKIFVTVGDRERAFGRDPGDNYMENVVIDVHGNSKGMHFGPGKKDVVQTDLYKAAILARNKFGHRQNTYKRHLGGKFRFILNSCETAGTAPQGLNIASFISRVHNVAVEASTKKTFGYTINPDGSVGFETYTRDGSKELSPSVRYERDEA